VSLTFDEGEIGGYRTVYTAARIVKLSWACPDQHILGEREG